VSMLGGRKVNKKGRSVGGRKSNRRTKIEGQFSPRLIEMLESPPYRVLSLSAHRILDRLEVELGHHGGADNGRLPCTYDHFEEFGIERHSIGPAIRECVALGFLEITEHGGGGNAEFRSPNLFRLTYRPTAGEPTHEWRSIETTEQAELIRRSARAAVPEKQNPSGGKSHVSVRNSHTENCSRPVWETPTTVPVWETPTASISPPDTVNRRANYRGLHQRSLPSARRFAR
jgi:hypothetical protein